MQDVGCRLRGMLAVLIATSTHDVQEQHAPLSSIHHVFDCRGDKP